MVDSNRVREKKHCVKDTPVLNIGVVEGHDGSTVDGADWQIPDKFLFSAENEVVQYAAAVETDVLHDIVLSNHKQSNQEGYSIFEETDEIRGASPFYAHEIVE